LSLSLAVNNPLLAKEMLAGCTKLEIASAWQNNRRDVEGVGYKVEYKK